MGDRTFKEVISEKEVARAGPSPIGLVSLEEEEIWTQPETEEDHGETRGEDSRLRAKERGPAETELSDSWTSDFWLPDLRKCVSAVVARAALLS